MNKFDLENIPAKEIIPGYKVKFVHSKNMTFAYWDIEAGATLPEHEHMHEQVSNLTAGEFEITVEGEKQFMKSGSVIVIPSNVRHSGTAITHCRMIDVFYPVREDYR